MKIAVTSRGKDLNAEIDERFGRAAFFIIVDPDTMAYEVVDNQQNINLSQGAGIQAAKILSDKHTDLLITGFCGPKAFYMLKQAGIKVITDVNKGRIIDAISDYKQGKLKPSASPNA